MYCGHDTTSIITNNTISGNYAYWGGHGICFEYASPYLNSNIIWDDCGPEVFGFGESSPVFEYCNIEDTLVSGIGNISVVPLFRDPTSGDFHLMATYCGDPYDSPCIDAGDPDILDYILDCDFGLGGERSDMGAYGGDNLGYPTEVIEEEVQIPEQLVFHQNYPNPFNATTTIGYSLPQESEVSLSIYNLLGQRIETLFEGTQYPGEHAITWDASYLPSGIYFSRLRIESATKSVKMLLLR